MDVLSLLGILIALGAVIGGNFIEGGHIDSLLQLTAFIIVVGGTLGAVLLQSPLPVFWRAVRMGLWVFKPPSIEPERQIESIVEWCQVARREGLLGLEGVSDELEEPFARKGLQMLVDGREPEAIRSALEVELDAAEEQLMHAAKVYEAAGGYAPTVGILGAVMGLIHVMENLADPSKLGAGIAVAFVATIYGVGAANLFLLPIANKLKSIIHRQSQVREMTIEGLAAIAEGENPRAIEAKLQGYVQ
ncbi:flagellar motor protein [Acidihalobacter prosperus]|uniref:Flagellar motor rotation protein MotA n=1 Tax=Acidihalobacter prosperus TaxID=160660 RepID=A0A1A6C5H4_9GAMM|nr:flagellar motor protein [Acidihalobacter prosperus]OBS09799.1 Flagellar motor rotation protein MotA [Acidihalobacter prosperus]